jgi:hypothetical protein
MCWVWKWICLHMCDRECSYSVHDHVQSLVSLHKSVTPLKWEIHYTTYLSLLSNTLWFLVLPNFEQPFSIFRLPLPWVGTCSSFSNTFICPRWRYTISHSFYIVLLSKTHCREFLSQNPSTVERLLLYEANPMSCVFQNIDPPPPSPPGDCVPPRLCLGGEDTLAGWRGGWGVNILEDAKHSSVLYLYRILFALN